MRKYLIGLCLILAIACIWLIGSLHKARSDNERLSNNQQALISDLEVRKTKSGELVASQQQLRLTYDELKGNYEDVCQEAKNLGLRLSRLQSYHKTGTSTNINIKADVRDSIVYRDRYVDTLKHFTWCDHPWVSVRGILGKDSVDLSIQSNDTLIQMIHRVPKRFLFFRFGCKAIRQEIQSKNPYSKITYSRYIELSK